MAVGWHCQKDTAAEEGGRDEYMYCKGVPSYIWLERGNRHMQLMAVLLGSIVIVPVRGAKSASFECTAFQVL